MFGCGELIDWFGFKALPNNVPEARAGVYCLLNLVTKKLYIGESVSVSVRLASHGDNSPRKLRNSLNKYGRHNFLVIPLWYGLFEEENKKLQQGIESQYIVEFDTIGNGYNVIQNYHQSAYGELWSNYLKQFWTEELRDRQSEITRQQFQEGDRRQKQIDAISALSNRPEVKQRFKELQQRLWSDPNYKPDRSWQREFFKTPELQAKARAAVARPEVIEKRNASITAAWQSSELRDQQAAAGRRKMATKRDTDPEAFQAHMSAFAQAGTEAAATRISGSRWINDGTANKRLSTSDPLPEGWSYGRVGFVKSRRPIS
jgi:group I intron endonuclease